MNGNMLMACGSDVPIGVEIDSFDPFGDGSGKMFFKFNGNCLEESGVYNGTPTAGISYGTGVIDQCLVDAAGGSVGLPTVAVGVFGSAISYSFYLKMTALSTALNSNIHDSSVGRILFGVGTTGQLGRLFIYTAASGLTMTGFSPPIGEFCHIVLTFTGTTVKLYVDGNLFQTFAKKSGEPSGTVKLGAAYNNTSLLNGALDHFRAFNKTLSDAEVTTLYNEGL